MSDMQNLPPFLVWFADQRGKAISAFDVDDWREAALSAASRIGTNWKPPGRPKSANLLSSAHTNYQALAWQVLQRIESTKQENIKLTINEAVEEEMLASVRRRNEDGYPDKNGNQIREGLVRTKIPTAYTEVRKIIKSWKAEK